MPGIIEVVPGLGLAPDSCQRLTTVKSLRACLLIATCLCSGLVPGSAAAHDFQFTEVVVLFKQDGTYLIDLKLDVDALVLGVTSSIPSEQIVQELEKMPEEELQRYVERAQENLVRRVRVRFDGEKQFPQASFPDRGTPLTAKSDEPTLFGTTARLEGTVPEGAEEFTFAASASLLEVHLTILDQHTLGGAHYVLARSERSPVYRLGQPAQAQPTLGVGWQYLILGFEHIAGFEKWYVMAPEPLEATADEETASFWIPWPLGFDHILFVLGLFLLGAELRPLLWQITSFTIAHSITLALSIYGIFSLSPQIVEPLIALSIAYVAIENIVTSELKPWRPVVVFAFGLLHGLGFAGVLSELGLPRNEFLTALVSFNLGVELGQLAIVGAALLLVGWFRHKNWYRSRIVIPASLVIGLVGLWWAVERTLFGV